ncbi:MAG: tetratricopeptide repeat protein [Polyangiaceae bacterium]
MSDPARLATSSASEEVRDLLRAARTASPPGCKERAMTVALEALALAAAAAAAAAPASAVRASDAVRAGSVGKTSVLTTVHWVGIACLAGAFAAGGLFAARADRTSMSPASTAVHPAAPRLEPPSVAPPVSPPAEDWSPVVDVGSLPTAQVPPAAPSSSRARPAQRAAAVASVANDDELGPLVPSAAPAPGPAPKLSPEIVLLDLTRKALAEGYGLRALTLLRDYDARFPDGALRSEATMMRIEALAAAGRRDEAARLGRSVIDRDPDGPYVARIRSLLGDTNP